MLLLCNDARQLVKPCAITNLPIWPLKFDCSTLIVKHRRFVLYLSGSVPDGYVENKQIQEMLHLACQVILLNTSEQTCHFVMDYI